LPFAGGSATSFLPLAKLWPHNWDVKTLTYPGRGSRISDPLERTLQSMVDDCWDQISSIIERPYVLLGHSLGATLAYLLTHRIILEKKRRPDHLFLCGTDAPCVPALTPHRHLSTSSELKLQLQKYGGIPEEIINDEEVFSFFESIIRADLEAIETWTYSKKAKLNINATVITGADDDLPDQDIQLWQEEFITPVTFRKMKGGHFFLFEQKHHFVDLINDTLSVNKIENIPLALQNPVISTCY